MDGGLYFEGDPATDSARRHMERVLKGEKPRRWPWLLAALGSAGLLFVWQSGRDAQRTRDGSSTEPKKTPAGP